MSEIQVLGPGGAPEQRGTPEPVGGDPLMLEVPVGPLARGVYTVSWKVVSAVDGHVTAGTFAFGVRASPRGVAATTSTTTPSSSRFELLARWVFLVGIVALLGGAAAAVARFGGSSGSDLALAAGGWAASVVGLALLTVAQLMTADSSLGELLDTSVGQALAWRGVTLGIVAVALLAAWRVPKKARRISLAIAAVAALATIVVHVDAGHAAAGSWSSAITVAAQSAHFAAAGVWFGGLAALLLGLRGDPSATKGAAVRRFATAAAIALVVVFVTGTLRAVDELSSWGELITSGYGRAVLAKVLLIGLIAGLAARNRRRVGVASSDLGPLRRTSGVELALAVVALAVAALLGTLAPPVSGQSATPTALTVSGSDFGTTTRVELVAASSEPGPNSFTVRVEDYDSGDPLEVDDVSLRFTPLDDPGIEPSSLKLSPGPDDSYVGSGSNLAFDGRWGVNVLVEHGAETAEVPLELELPGPKQFVSTLRIPGRLPKYTMQVGTIGYLRIEPDPERAGPSKVYVTSFTAFGSISRVAQLVVTAAPAGELPRQQVVRRLGAGRFVASIDLKSGPFEIAVVAQTRDGTRLRGVFELEVPSD